MIPGYSNQSSYVSCIKIAGASILPPLMSEGRRKEVNEDKAKAIEIEKKLRRKRSSIDSGVMTGSYIDNYKNCETQQPDDLLINTLSILDITPNEIKKNDLSSQPCETNNVVSDSFLKSALEDSEFREFFYSTAEKIFKDNKTSNCSQQSSENDPKTAESTNCFLIPSNSGSTDIFANTLDSSSLPEPNNIHCFNSCNNLSSSPEKDIECSKIIKNDVFETSLTLDPPVLVPQLVRRNSYTLENPSPVLLEHIAKEIANSKVDTEDLSSGLEIDKWKSPIAKTEKHQGLGFKTFSSARKSRKPWNKNVADQFVSLIDDPFVSKRQSNKIRLKRSKTFVKGGTKKETSNNSLPCSSRTSPIPFSLYTQSVDCIQSMLENTQIMSDQNTSNSITKLVKEAASPETSNPESVMFDKKNIVIIHKGVDLGTAFPSMLNTSPKSNISGSVQTNLTDRNFSNTSQDDLNDSLSQTSAITQSTLCQQKIHLKNDPLCRQDTKVYQNKDSGNENYDSVSLCSSLSLSKFMASDDNESSVTTAEDLSTLFSELQLQHEREITELLAKQHNEKVMLTKLHSRSGSLSSRTTTTQSAFDITFNSNSSEQTKTLCSRELFPTEITEKSNNLIIKECYSEKEKIAASKLTACVRGYLTRRLLKTEKVQQLIDIIKESLNCAFSLQLEPQLKRNDLELHERLAHQLSAALYELQSIISAPVAKRMAIIATDREKLRKPTSRPSSTISSATRKSILRRQLSMNNTEKKCGETSSRPKSSSFSVNSGSSTSVSKSESQSISNTSISRKLWR